MTKNQRKARKKALRQAQKERRKENTAQAPQSRPAGANAVEERQIEMKNEPGNDAGKAQAPRPITDERARELLLKAVETTAEVIEMVRAAIERVDHDDANAIHAEQIKAQARRYRALNVSADEKTLIRAHPLYPLVRLLIQSSKHLKELLAVTNPKLFAASKLEVDAELQKLKADRLRTKADKVAA